MDSIPDAWPPAHLEEASGPVPMFPLPGVFLFPRQLMPLHIFEPRYRSMIEDSLDGPGRLVMSTIVEAEADETAGAPAVLPVAGLGEIARHEKLDDGRFLVWLFGLSRVRIQEISSETTYRRVRFEQVTETDATPDAAKRLREPLTQAILARMDTFLNLPDDVPIGLLTDLLSQRMELPQAVLGPIFAEPDAVRRAELALAAHEEHPPAGGDPASD